MTEQIKFDELDQVQKDLGKYADDKLTGAMKDIVQAFEIADRSLADAIACISCKTMGIGLDILHSVHGMTREQWLVLCTTLWDAKERGRKRGRKRSRN